MKAHTGCTNVDQTPALRIHILVMLVVDDFTPGFVRQVSMFVLSITMQIFFPPAHG